MQLELARASTGTSATHQRTRYRTARDILLPVHKATRDRATTQTSRTKTIRKSCRMPLLPLLAKARTWKVLCGETDSGSTCSTSDTFCRCSAMRQHRGGKQLERPCGPLPAWVSTPTSPWTTVRNEISQTCPPADDRLGRTPRVAKALRSTLVEQGIIWATVRAAQPGPAVAVGVGVRVQEGSSNVIIITSISKLRLCLSRSHRCCRL